MAYDKESELNSGQQAEYDFRWYEIGEENPFNKRILDVRPLTWNVVAVTKDKEIAKTYHKLRSSFGKEYVNQHIENGSRSDLHLEYPHNGDALEGVVFKADSMDCKWDIYIYNNIFYFTRSWTGELIYKAHAEVLQDKIIIYKIEFPEEAGFNRAQNDVHFLIKTHAMGQVLPHKVPEYLDTDMAIALYTFSQFGNKGCYACFDDIIDTIITTKD